MMQKIEFPAADTYWIAHNAGHLVAWGCVSPYESMECMRDTLECFGTEAAMNERLAELGIEV